MARNPQIRPRPTIATPDTLILGAWVEDGVLALTATLRTAANEVRPGVLEATGDPLCTLARALQELAVLKTRNLLLLTNDDDLLRWFSSPFRYNDMHPSTWPPEFWRCLIQSTDYFLRGTWCVRRVDNLPKARDLWLQQRNSA